MSRAVLVVAPGDLDGAVRLKSAGASAVTVCGPGLGPSAAPAGLNAVEGLAEVGAGTIDVVVAVDDAQAWSEGGWLDACSVVLRPHGMLAVRLPAVDASPDFWELERRLRGAFGRVFSVAQTPWAGVAMTPIADEGVLVEPTVRLDEALLSETPPPSHYLAVACRGAAPFGLASTLERQCLLVPTPGPAPDELQAELEALEARASQAQGVLDAARLDFERREGERARDKARAVGVAEQALDAARREFDRSMAERDRELRGARDAVASIEAQLQGKRAELEALQRNVTDLERGVERAHAWAEERAAEARARLSERDDLKLRMDALVAERDSLASELQLAIAERERSSQSLSRVEAELDVARRRQAGQEEQLADRAAEIARLGAETEGLRARLSDHDRMLERSSAEQGRALSEIALDRDRLREELTRRTQQLGALEDRIGKLEDDLRAELARGRKSSGDLERARVQLERSRVVETERQAELERLGAEVHELQVHRDRARTQAARAEEELDRMRQAFAQQTSEASEALRAEHEARVVELDRVARERDELAVQAEAAQNQCRQREAQLADVGSEMERMRRALEEQAATSAALDAELEVKDRELERLGGTLRDLQRTSEQHRLEQEAYELRARDLQRELERSQAEQQQLRGRLREREQSLEDLMQAHETSGVEVFKLRRELEATAAANEKLESALDRDRERDDGDDTRDWPEAARIQLRQLEALLDAQARSHAQELARRVPEARGDVDRDRVRSRRLQLEIDVRAQEQEHALALLDSAEQRIWEMTDESDRNAARLAASLAQLEKQREQFDETVDELEVTRRLLATAQERSLEQERELARGRARMARFGGMRAAEGNGASREPETEELAIADVQAGRPATGAPARARVRVEPLDPGDWQGDDDELVAQTPVGTGRRPGLTPVSTPESGGS